MLLKCTRRINHRKRVISSAIALIIIASSIAGAVFTAPVAVYALSALGIKSTIASIIISLMLQSGVAPVNTNYLNTLNASYGYTIETAISDGLLTETANGIIDTGLSSAIESASAYTELGLSEIFTTTADDVGVIVAEGATNIATSVTNVANLGSLGAFGGAVAIGVGVGILANHLRNMYRNYIRSGLSVEMDPHYVNLTPAGQTCYVYCYPSASDFYINGYYYAPSNAGFAGYKFDDSSYSMQIGAVNGTYNYSICNGTTKELLRQGSSSFGEYGASIYNMGYNGTWGNAYTNGRLFNSPSEVSQYFNDLKNGAVQNNLYSPDLIGKFGNQYYDASNDSYPGISNQIPEGKDMIPVDMDDYQDFADQANDNTQNGDTGQEIQGEAFDDFIDPYIVDTPTIPDQPIIPENPDEVPEVPDRPIVPEQPTIPDKPNIDQETLDKALEGATTIDLRSIFPFCIPFDLYNILLIFDTGENRKAPHITFTFPITGWEIDVDLAPFDPVAGILRLLELILFIIGLAVATRALIGAGGGS